MSDEADARVEPAWIVRMREAGYDVRTGSGDLPEKPEVDFSLPRATRIGIRRRVWMLLSASSSQSPWRCTVCGSPHQQ